MRILHIGNVGNYAYSVVKFLRKRNVEADLLVKTTATADSNPMNEDAYLKDPANRPDWIKYWDPSLLNKLRLIGLVRKYDIIHAYAGAPVYAQFFLKPYVAWTLGSDLRKVAFEKSIYSILLKRGFKKSSKLIFSSPDQLEIIEKYNFKNAEFVPQLIDLDEYPVPSNGGRSSYNCDLLLFHPTRFDWENKGNDRLLSAFARFVREGNSAKMILVDWGIDREKSKDLIRKLGVSDKIIFVSFLEKKDLFRYYGIADVVVDQFVIGTYGLIALYAMACSKPVMTNISEAGYKKCYGSVPPVLNTNSEKDIYNKLIEIRDKRGKINAMGKASRRWVAENNDWKKGTDKLINIYNSIKIQ